MPQRNEFPESILVETTLRCPADCVFCPNKKITNRPADMSWELFKKIVDECQGKAVREFYPFINGEPLACPFLEDALDYVSRTLPGTSIIIYTNGSLLNDWQSSLLLKNNVDEVHFSIDGISKLVYENHRKGLIYEQVMANVMRFLARLQKHPGKIKTRVVLTMTPDNTKEVTAFRRLWKGLVDIVDVIPCDGRGGEGKEPVYLDNRTLGCFYVSSRAYILTDGSVVPCCKDWAGYSVLGNVADDSLQSIWNSADYDRLRNDVSRGIFSNFEVCRRCVTDNL